MRYKDINKLALDVRAIFEEHCQILNDLSFPFFFDFPKNSCQSASVFFGVCLKQLFPDLDVKIVHGRTRGDSDHHHFWVEVNEKIYDLTLDQFQSWLGERYDGLNHPVYDVKKHPLAGYFFYKERSNVSDSFIEFITGYANLAEVMNAFNFCYIELQRKGWFSNFNELSRD